MSRHRKLTRKFAGFPMFKLATSGETFPVTSPFTTGFTGLETDQLALDLQFATDKTLTARKGPTPVFVRGSGATFVDSDKLVKWAPENLYSFSQSFGEVFWTKIRTSVQVDATIAPDGTLTADKLVEDTTPTSTHQIGSGITPSALPHRLSVFAKKAERNFIVLRLGGLNDFFNLNTGVATTNLNSPTITDVGNGWYRCSVVSSAGTQGGFATSIDGITNSYTGDGTSGVFIWGAQLERSSTLRTYNPTTTAAFYGPRFDHDPVTGVCKGLLMEESRTNLVLQSENFGTTWQVNGASITLDTVDSPDGVTADRLNEDATNANHQVIQQVGSLTAGQAYTISVFAKAASHTTFQLTTSTVAFGSNLFANFILTGLGSVGASNGVTTKIESYLNGWYRCSIAISSVTGGTGGFVQIASNNNNSAIGRLIPYVGTNAQVVHLWGAQVELGSFATSYIPTTTASVVRSADVCSITGSAFTALWNPLEGSLFASGTGRNYVVMASGATNANQIAFLRNISPKYLRWDIANNGNYTAQVASQIVTEETFVKSAGSYASNDARAAFNGTLGTQDLTVTIPSLIALNIGSASGGGQQLNGTIGAVRYYRKPLSNSRLQAITV